MKTIYKYEIPLDNRVLVRMPDEAIIRKIAPNQKNAQKLWCWAEVDTERPTVEKSFLITGTGHPIPDTKGFRYFDSVIAGTFVWHVWIEDAI